MVKKIKNPLNFCNFTGVFVKMCKIRKNGGFLHSQSQISQVEIIQTKFKVRKMSKLKPRPKNIHPP